MRVLMALRRSGKPFALRPTDLFTGVADFFRRDHQARSIGW